MRKLIRALLFLFLVVGSVNINVNSVLAGSSVPCNSSNKCECKKCDSVIRIKTPGQPYGHEYETFCWDGKYRLVQGDEDTADSNVDLSTRQSQINRCGQGNTYRYVHTDKKFNENDICDMRSVVSDANYNVPVYWTNIKGDKKDDQLAACWVNIVDVMADAEGEERMCPGSCVEAASPTYYVRLEQQSGGGYNGFSDLGWTNPYSTVFVKVKNGEFHLRMEGKCEKDNRVCVYNTDSTQVSRTIFTEDDLCNLGTNSYGYYWQVGQGNGFNTKVAFDGNAGYMNNCWSKEVLTSETSCDVTGGECLHATGREDGRLWGLLDYNDWTRLEVQAGVNTYIYYQNFYFNSLGTSTWTYDYYLKLPLGRCDGDYICGRKLGDKYHNYMIQGGGGGTNNDYHKNFCEDFLDGRINDPSAGSKTWNPEGAGVCNYSAELNKCNYNDYDGGTRTCLSDTQVAKYEPITQYPALDCGDSITCVKVDDCPEGDGNHACSSDSTEISENISVDFNKCKGKANDAKCIPLYTCKNSQTNSAGTCIKIVKRDAACSEYKASYGDLNGNKNQAKWQCKPYAEAVGETAGYKTRTDGETELTFTCDANKVCVTDYNKEAGSCELKLKNLMDCCHGDPGKESPVNKDVLTPTQKKDFEGLDDFFYDGISYKYGSQEANYSKIFYKRYLDICETQQTICTEQKEAWHSDATCGDFKEKKPPEESGEAYIKFAQCCAKPVSEGGWGLDPKNPPDQSWESFINKCADMMKNSSSSVASGCDKAVTALELAQCLQNNTNLNCKDEYKGHVDKEEEDKGKYGVTDPTITGYIALDDVDPLNNYAECGVGGDIGTCTTTFTTDPVTGEKSGGVSYLKNLDNNKKPTLGYVITQAVNNFVFPIALILLLILLIWGGVEIVVASTAGQQNKIDMGKKRVTAAIVGFVILFAAYGLLQLIETVLGLKISQ